MGTKKAIRSVAALMKKRGALTPKQPLRIFVVKFEGCGELTQWVVVGNDVFEAIELALKDRFVGQSIQPILREHTQVFDIGTANVDEISGIVCRDRSKGFKG